jgi:hypothetical protein
MTRHLIPAFVLPIALTAVTLSGVAWNRSGGTGDTVLSRRELSPSVTSEDNTSRSLRINYQPSWRGGEDWLKPAKLADLGFDTALDPASPDAERHYQRSLPREVFVALELDGPAWQALLREEERQSADAPPRPDGYRLATHGSRLVPVDAALDAAALEAAYPNRRTHLITRGVVRLLLYTPRGERPRLSGVTERIAPSELHVPAHLSSRLGQESYRVTVRYGRRYQPWVVTIE